MKETFDAVKMTREIRDSMSREMENMTAEERAQYIRDRTAWSKIGKQKEHDSKDTDDQCV